MGALFGSAADAVTEVLALLARLPRSGWTVTPPAARQLRDALEAAGEAAQLSEALGGSPGDTTFSTRLFVLAGAVQKREETGFALMGGDLLILRRVLAETRDGLRLIESARSPMPALLRPDFRSLRLGLAQDGDI